MEQPPPPPPPPRGNGEHPGRCRKTTSDYTPQVLNAYLQNQRSTRACVRCKARKIKCLALKKGGGCVACENENQRCMVIENGVPVDAGHGKAVTRELGRARVAIERLEENLEAVLSRRIHRFNFDPAIDWGNPDIVEGQQSELAVGEQPLDRTSDSRTNGNATQVQQTQTTSSSQSSPESLYHGNTLVRVQSGSAPRSHASAGGNQHIGNQHIGNQHIGNMASHVNGNGGTAHLPSSRAPQQQSSTYTTDSPYGNLRPNGMPGSHDSMVPASIAMTPRSLQVSAPPPGLPPNTGYPPSTFTLPGPPLPPFPTPTDPAQASNGVPFPFTLNSASNGAPNGAPNCAPNYAPNGTPNGAPHGAPHGAPRPRG